MIHIADFLKIIFIIRSYHPDSYYALFEGPWVSQNEIRGVRW